MFEIRTDENGNQFFVAVTTTTAEPTTTQGTVQDSSPCFRIETDANGRQFVVTDTSCETNTPDGQNPAETTTTPEPESRVANFVAEAPREERERLRTRQQPNENRRPAPRTQAPTTTPTPANNGGIGGLIRGLLEASQGNNPSSGGDSTSQSPAELERLINDALAKQQAENDARNAAENQPKEGEPTPEEVKNLVQQVLGGDTSGLGRFTNGSPVQSESANLVANRPVASGNEAGNRRRGNRRRNRPAVGGAGGVALEGSNLSGLNAASGNSLNSNSDLNAEQQSRAAIRAERQRKRAARQARRRGELLCNLMSLVRVKQE